MFNQANVFYLRFLHCILVVACCYIWIPSHFISEPFKAWLYGEAICPILKAINIRPPVNVCNLLWDLGGRLMTTGICLSLKISKCSRSKGMWEKILTRQVPVLMVMPLPLTNILLLWWFILFPFSTDKCWLTETLSLFKRFNALSRAAFSFRHVHS